MYNSNPISDFAMAVSSALLMDLPAIPYKAYKTEEIRLRRPSVNDIEVFSFPQTWASTALGFGGIGGSAITQAQTTVVTCEGSAAVYFAGRHAYTIENYSSILFDKIRSHDMPAVGQHGFLKRASK